LGEAHLKTYVGTLAAFAASLAASWLYWYELVLDPRLILGAAIFAAFFLLSDVFSVRINERLTIDVSDIGLIVAVIALGPVWAVVAALPADMFVARRDWLRAIYEISHSITIIFLAGVVFSFASEPLLLGEPGPLPTVLYGTLVAGTTLAVASKALYGVLMRIKFNQALHETWKETVQPYLLPEAINVLTAGAGALALVEYGPLAALIVVAGSVASQALVYRSREQVKENHDLRARVGSLEEALATSNTTFGTMIIQDLGRRDGYTHRHAAATAVYAADLAREMKLDDTRAEQLRMAGLLHNVGLFGLAEDLLLATGKLNSIAQSRLAEHPARGEKAIAAIPEFEEMAGWVRWHHERPDGRGYPDKLRGSWIPLEAKILAVAQAYAAMVLDQPRRPGMGSAEAREKLSAGIDTEFDGVVVRAFLRILDTESEGYRMADDHRFVFPAPEERERARPGVPETISEAGGGRVRSFPS
jgi:HD-GYP domain-containing protein (c-di-GMP phosphodiesterase class II)/predicted membrane protein